MLVLWWLLCVRVLAEGQRYGLGDVYGLAVFSSRIKPLVAVLGAGTAPRMFRLPQGHGNTVVAPAGTVVPSRAGAISIHLRAQSGLHDVGIAFLEDAPQNLDLPFTSSPAPRFLGSGWLRDLAGRATVTGPECGQWVWFSARFLCTVPGTLLVTDPPK